MSQTTQKTVFEAVQKASKVAKKEYRDNKETLPFGFVHIENLDGRSKTVREIKNKGIEKKNKTFSLPNQPIRISKNSYKGGYDLYLDFANSQSMDKKTPAYREFLRVMQQYGYLGSAKVYSRMD